MPADLQTPPAPPKRVPLARLTESDRRVVKRVIDTAEQVNGLPVAAFNSSI